MKFSKMHGLGNDFMVIDAVSQSVKLTKSDVVHLGRRDIGVGFDQCLLVEKSGDPTVDFFYRIYNADGSEVGQCGNGARCLARFIQHQGLSNKTVLTVATKTTRMRLSLLKNDQVSVRLSAPRFAPSDVPISANLEEGYYRLDLDDGLTQAVRAVNVGNPHAVVLVDDVSQAPVNRLGKIISHHPCFPEQCNVGFMQMDSPSTIQLRVYERGCGETRACGSGAVAAAVIGRQYHKMNAKIAVELLGGSLQVEWESCDAPIELIGPATFVYHGELA